MLGLDFYRNEVDFTLNTERLKSLVLFYEPLIGKDALMVYEYCALRDNSMAFNTLNELLADLNINIDLFEKALEDLNRYNLVKTLNKDNYYIFVYQPPKDIKEFIKDEILSRKFILKTSGEYFQKLSSYYYFENSHSGFDNISKRFEAEELSSWTKENETYLTNIKKEDSYDFGTMFNINIFLRDLSKTVFPLKYRSYENLKEIALLADLYNISYDKMRVIIAKVVNYSIKNNVDFDLNELRKKAYNAQTDYQKVENDKYDVPCQLYLMSRQNGKALTPTDKKLIYSLARDYHLTVPVINVLLDYSLTKDNNTLIAYYIYQRASDLHRNDIKTSKEALNRLNMNNSNTAKTNKDYLPTYDDSNNAKLSEEQMDEIERLMRNG